MSEELIYHGRIFDLVKLDGKYDAIKHPGAAFIVPVIDVVKSDIIVIETFRPVINETVWELPAGLLDPGEAPQKTAHRELLEETGYNASRVVPLGNGPYYSSYGFSTERCFFFAALGLDKTDQAPDGEASSINIMNSMEMIGKVKSATVLLALMLYHAARADGRIHGLK